MTAGNIAAALAEKADRRHLHTAGDVLGFGEAVRTAVDACYFAERDETIEMASDTAYKYAVCDGLTLPPGIYAMEVRFATSGLAGRARTAMHGLGGLVAYESGFDDAMVTDGSESAMFAVFCVSDAITFHGAKMPTDTARGVGFSLSNNARGTAHCATKIRKLV